MNEIYLSLTLDGNQASIMAATKSNTGVVTPIASETEQVPVASNLYGTVSLSDDNRLAVSRLLRKILNKIEGENEVIGVYLGIMPRSMRGEPIEVRRDFNGKHRITEHDIENLDREIVNSINNTVVTKYDNGFVRDGLETFNVRNELADYIIRKSLAVVVNPRLLPDLRPLLPEGVRLHDLVPTHIAIARVVADEEQRVNGVMSFHIGNQSSGLTYMLNDMVMGTAVVPFGFDHILNDMTLGQIPVERIRSFFASSKMKYKWAAGATVRFTSDGEPFSLCDSIDAFNARIREIFSLAYDRILASLNLEELKVPLLVTTSFINTPEFAEALSDLLEQDCVIGNASNVLNDDKFDSPRFIPLVSIINEATKPCVEESVVKIEETAPKQEPEPEQTEEKHPKKPKKTIWDRLKNQATLFNDEQ